jgi:hypothetical protein
MLVEHLSCYLVSGIRYFKLGSNLGILDARLERNYWKSTQPCTQLCLMEEWPTRSCHSLYKDIAQAERMISIFNQFPAPATNSSKLTISAIATVMVLWLGFLMVVKTTLTFMITSIADRTRDSKSEISEVNRGW